MGVWLCSGSTQRKGLLGSSVPKNAGDFLATASPLLSQRSDEEETWCVGRIEERKRAGERTDGGKKGPFVFSSGIWQLLASEVPPISESVRI